MVNWLKGGRMVFMQRGRARLEGLGWSCECLVDGAGVACKGAGIAQGRRFGVARGFAEVSSPFVGIVNERWGAG
ncbi:hypothetical protein EPH_0036160 [Eimeria praecox]|uniref:Uncharacterized protein n=1 Tax=Eimeria praecox TaxID=51316 RepID=U6G3J1_9EIME|nr:hypothetical protein EPH_0036160 [Eimeria praecox]